MTLLTPMGETEFAAYLETAIPDFAQDKVNAGQWAPAESLELSRTSYAESLPQGLATPDNYLFTVRDGATSEQIGMLWFAAQERGGQRIAYVYDVAIDAEHQRKGHASRAFAAMEVEVLKRGLSGIALHVFGQNTGAQAFYQKLGYLPTNINMFKQLPVRAAE
ncbi:GNAT family N-acetyltransferase [Rhodoferax sp. AJA081-3]|uniref:GNAT family N-acetyltransferase n=1 Tax=Rhodoferax sp. AJA081-3 TaxID=2752316 RepID=UPI001ADFC41F|nr:GNAT family N-acetyltransferase [Rhodoferax sp. AJA081-3]QTN26983.1 GNAT family N-acetyltransferase [Rhodoferax sp. AJA081-3]